MPTTSSSTVSGPSRARPRCDPFVADLNVSAAWPVNLKGVIQEMLTGYLVNSILSKWLMVTMPSDAEAYAKLANGHLLGAVNLLYRRNKPERRE